MKKFNLWKLLFSVFFACAAMAFAGCVDDNDDEGMPYLEVTPPQLAFDESGAPAAGSTGKFAVKTNRPWQLIVEEKDADWVRPSATEGKGSGEVSFNLPATVGGRSAKLTFQVINPYGPYITQEVTLTQGEVVAEQLIYNETFGTTGDKTPVADYTGWDKTGEGASTVTYGGSGCDIRSNLVSSSYSNYAGSGGSNLMFGNGETSFIINSITLPAEIDTYTLTFGASYYQAPDTGIFDQLTVAFSADGQEWTDAVPYVFDGFVAGNNWNLATIDFTLAKHIDQLYIKFMSTKKPDGNYRIDDVKLVTSNGGEVINVGEPAPLTVTPAALTLGSAAGATATLSVKALDAWTATSSGSGFSLDITSGDAGTATVTVTAEADNTGDAAELGTIVFTSGEATKTVTVSQEAGGGSVDPTDDIFYETFGAPEQRPGTTFWPYVDQCTSYSKIGSGYVEGTTAYKGYNTTIRIVNSATSPNPPFSGEGHCWFPSGKTIDKNYFEVDKLVLNGQKNLTIQFGVYGNTAAYEDGAIVLEVSGDGTTWKTLNFNVSAIDGASPEWKLAKADFTLANAVEHLYVKWSSAAGNARMDDLRLYEGQGGETVDLGEGGTAATLEVAPLSLTLGNAAGAAKTFEITTTAAWTATVSGSGFSLDKTSGTGNATVTVTAEAANAETSVKELGSIAVAAEGVAESKTVKVSQAAASSTDPGDENQIVVDFSRGADMATPALANRDANAKDETYVIDGHTFKVHANDKFYWWENTYQEGNPASLFIGKLGSYIELPAIADKALTGVTIVQAIGGGSGVGVSIQTLGGTTLTGGDAIAMNAGETAVWTLSDTENNTSYRVYIGTSKNLHIAKLTLSYGDGGGSTTTTPQITAVDPASVSFEAAGGTQTIAVTVADQGDNALSVSGLSGLLDATVSGNTVTVTAEANTGEAVNQTLTVSVAGGNSVEVPVSIAAGNTGGDAPAAGTVLWAETWASYGASSTTFANNKVIGDYDYAGQTLYNPDGADYKVTYTADENNAVRATTSTGANMVDGHLWFNKSAAGTWTISAIKLYGATSLKLSHAQGTSGSAVEALYSIDGTEWTSLGTQNGPIAEKTYTFTVPAGTESVQIRFAHPASNAKNTRADSFQLTVGE